MNKDIFEEKEDIQKDQQSIVFIFLLVAIIVGLIGVLIC